jgi:hypothetical protein
VVDIHGFVDKYWAGDLDHRISTSGYVFNLFRGAISWMRQKTGCSGTFNYKS